MRGENSGKKILIVQHDESEGPGLFLPLAGQRGIPAELCRLYEGGKIPASLENVLAVISLGGPMNVYAQDEYPFLRDEEEMIKRALTEEVPILGVCLGAQMLAKAAGARVTSGPRKEIGLGRIFFTSEGKADPLFTGFESEIQVFQWHGDTFEIPHKGILLASSEIYPHQAFRIKSKAYGLQFHLEATADMVADWVIRDRQELINESFNPEIIIKEMAAESEKMGYWMQKLWDNFLASVVGRTPKPL